MKSGSQRMYQENESQELFKNIKKYSLQQMKSSCNVETLTMERSVNKNHLQNPFHLLSVSDVQSGIRSRFLGSGQQIWKKDDDCQEMDSRVGFTMKDC